MKKPDLEAIEIVCQAIAVECSHPTNIYLDKMFGAIVVDPINKQRSTWILDLSDNKAMVCCHPAHKLTYDLNDPDSIPKIARAIDQCVDQPSCQACRINLNYIELGLIDHTNPKIS